MKTGAVLRLAAREQAILRGSGVRFVCPFCRLACTAGVSAYGAVIANHAAPHCIERASSSSLEFMRAVRSKLGGDT